MARAWTVLFFLLLAGVTLAQRSYDVDILAETFGFDESTKKTVELANLQQGCPARDCIHSIDAPKYITAEQAPLSDNDIVVTLSYDGEYRAYPTRILDHHEIVNDTIAGTPLAITWCPLCGSAVGIHRQVGDQLTEFGVSGVLYNSDLVLYDRATETLWDQIEAKGIVGPMTGEQLRFIPLSMTQWGRWRQAHPDTLVLSSDTGFEEDYSTDRYAEYRDSTRLYMPVSNSDDRIHPKTVVYGFELESGSIAFDAALVEENRSYSHDLDGATWELRAGDDGAVTLRGPAQESVYSPIRLFWFAWYTFHPQTELVR
jgi:hypothetical protein